MQRISLACVDFGIGIPVTVRSVQEVSTLDDGEAIEWALLGGNTSKPGNRGMGLDILRSFVQVNGGAMDLLSHRGHVRITEKGQVRLKRNLGFPGTVLNLTFNADERYYAFKGEIQSADIF
jgi:hypothetical protein